jgi:glucosamine--fructose-6-phosphate aminotransferase (isomerizing)
MSRLMDSLARLEYRGYDSAGVVLVQESGELWRQREADGTKSLVKLRRAQPPRSVCGGLGHTRWATHGPPTVGNAHPHLDCRGRLAVVHNGTVENYRELAAGLIERGHNMVSETDSEILAHLVEEELANSADDLLGALRRALTGVRGSYAVAVMSADHPGEIAAARLSSPLLVGRAGGVAMLASDPTAMVGLTRSMISVEDGEAVRLSGDALEVIGPDGQMTTGTELVVDWDIEEAEKGGYPDFMAKEIHEQPGALRVSLGDRIDRSGVVRLDELRLDPGELARVNKVFVVGCGSSYHAGLVAKYAIEHWARLPVEIDVASEFRYRDPVVDPATLVVTVSQSGETLDTLQAQREASRFGAKVMAVTNVVGSSMAREADAVLFTRSGPEIGVASTKTTLAQVAVLELVALYLAEQRLALYPSEVATIVRAMQALPDDLERLLSREAEVAAVAHSVSDARDFFFLGRHVGFPIALEGALKLKEIAYKRAEGYPAGELKHGPIALIEPGTVVVVVATRGRLHEKIMANVAEVKARGARVIALATDGDEVTAREADQVLWVPEAAELLTPLLALVPMQLFAYHLARSLGNEVDRPRNLAKTVTVE